MSLQADRVMPHDLTAERAVLGAVLVEPDLFDVADGCGLKSVQFFRDAHRRIWDAYARLRAANAVIDFVTVRGDLESHGSLEEVGGPVYIAGLTDGVPRSMNVEGYATIVRDKAMLRDLIAQASQTIEAAYDGDDLHEVIDAAERRLLALGTTTSRGEFIAAPQWMSAVFTAIGKAADDPRDITGIPCGIPAIDKMTRGWQPSNLIIIGGRPGDGKTSLMMQMADTASRHVNAAIVSLEMSIEECGFRAVALEARLDAFRMMTGRLRDHEMQRVGDAIQRLSSRGLFIDDWAGQTVSGVCAKLRRLHARVGLGIIFVDYLQLLSGSNAENKTQEISQISGRLLALAKDLKVPVVVLSQLTRDSAKGGPAARPQLHQLRDGGSIEQDAHVVLFIHRPNRQQDSARFQEQEEIELVLAKQRNGPTGVRKAHWDGPTMRFTDAEAGPQLPRQERLA